MLVPANPTLPDTSLEADGQSGGLRVTGAVQSLPQAHCNLPSLTPKQIHGSGHTDPSWAFASQCLFPPLSDVKKLPEMALERPAWSQ
jgi:hypothetical protein